jgi:hypothetical protein
MRSYKLKSMLQLIAEQETEAGELAVMVDSLKQSSQRLNLRTSGYVMAVRVERDSLARLGLHREIGAALV